MSRHETPWWLDWPTDRDKIIAVACDADAAAMVRRFPGEGSLKTWRESLTVAQVLPPESCPITVWDGPYSFRCGYVVRDGRCVRHGQVFKP